MGKIVESLLGGAGSLLGSAVGAITTASENAKDRKWNAEQAQLNREFQTSEREATQAYNTSEREAAQLYNTSEREAVQAYNTSEREAAQDWNLEMWNLENEYNDPSAQMERMVAAGINPNAVAAGMAGNGSVAGGVQGSSGASSSPGSVSGASSTPGSGSMAHSNVDPTALGDILGGSVNSMWQNMDIQNAIAGKQLDNRMKQKELGVFDETWMLNQKEIQSRIDKALADAGKSKSETDLNVQQFEFLKDKNPVELQTMNMMYQRVKSEVDQIGQQIENLKKQYDLTDEMIKESEARQKNIDADTGLKESQTDLTDAEKAMVDVNKLLARQKFVIDSIEVQAAQKGISFSAPDYWNAYNYEKTTGKKFSDLCKPNRENARKDSWIGVGPRLVGEAAGAATTLGAAYVGGKAAGKGMSAGRGSIVEPYSSGGAKGAIVMTDPYTGQPVWVTPNKL